MTLNAYVVWAVLGCVLVAAELAVGTFHLLVLGVAAFAAAAASYAFGLGPGWQLAVAAVVAVLGVVLIQRMRRPPSGEAGPDTDRGNLVQIAAETPLKVRYRGAIWAAEAESAETDLTQPLYVKSVHDNTVVVTNRRGSRS